MMKVRKGVITAAGRGTRQYPASNTVQKEMFPLVDVDGLTKPTIQIIAEEALDAGIEELCIVTAPGDEEMYRRHFQSISGDLLSAFRGKEWALQESEKLARIEQSLSYATQTTPEGYGHAVYAAREWVGDEPFLLLLGDHVYITADSTGRRCARQVVDVFERTGQTVSAVKRTPERLLHLFGTVRGEPLPGAPATYRVTAMVEKPSPERAAQDLRTPGLNPGDYLCFFGMHVFTPAVFDCLAYNIAHDVREKGEFQLTAAQAMVAEREPYLAFETQGERYDMGIPFGLAETQLALALHSPMREEMITSLVRILADQGRGYQPGARQLAANSARSPSTPPTRPPNHCPPRLTISACRAMAISAGTTGRCSTPKEKPIASSSRLTESAMPTSGRPRADAALSILPCSPSSSSSRRTSRRSQRPVASSSTPAA
ncbi:MAG: sugar phosphate nucleotidyltransferase [Chloroflexota bacterium]